MPKEAEPAEGRAEDWKRDLLMAIVAMVACVLSVVATITTLTRPMLDQVGKRIDALDTSMDRRIIDLKESVTTQIQKSEDYLNGRIDDIDASLNQRIDDNGQFLITRVDQLNVSVNERINTLQNPVPHAPFPEPAMLPPDKLLEISKQELLAAEPGEEAFTVPAGDYVVLPISFRLGETTVVQWQTLGEGEEDDVDFYLLSAEGYLHRYTRDSEYDSPWVSPNDAPFYFYFTNTFDPSKPKTLWIRLVEGD